MGLRHLPNGGSCSITGYSIRGDICAIMTIPFDWVGDAFIATGLYGIGNQKRGAFLFSIAGESCWMWWSYTTQNWALLAICTLFNVLTVRSYLKWGQTNGK